MRTDEESFLVTDDADSYIRTDDESYMRTDEEDAELYDKDPKVRALRIWPEHRSFETYVQGLARGAEILIGWSVAAKIKSMDIC